jgi:hypothetical protein
MSLRCFRRSAARVFAATMTCIAVSDLARAASFSVPVDHASSEQSVQANRDVLTSSTGFSAAGSAIWRRMQAGSLLVLQAEDIRSDGRHLTLVYQRAVGRPVAVFFAGPQMRILDHLPDNCGRCTLLQFVMREGDEQAVNLLLGADFSVFLTPRR